MIWLPGCTILRMLMMSENRDLPFSTKLGWSFVIVLALILSPVLFILEVLWGNFYHAKDIFIEYDNEVLSLARTLKSLWDIDYDDYGFA